MYYTFLKQIDLKSGNVVDIAGTLEIVVELVRLQVATLEKLLSCEV